MRIEAATPGRPETRVRPASTTDRRSASVGTRAQTTIDFAVGMGIFLLALTFVFSFVPGMIQPFTGGTQAETPAANRVADDLVTRTLGNASQPYVLDVRCTRGLFTDSPPTDCQYGSGTMAERVGVKARTAVNVTVRGELSGDGESDVLCWDSDASPAGFVERGSAACDPEDPANSDVLLTRGPRPSGSGGKTVSAQRVGLLDGQDVTVEVVMW